MTVNIQGIYGAQYTLLKSTDAGAAVRVLLGAGAASITHAEELATASGLPALPLIAFREGAAIGTTRNPWAITATWYVYDAQPQRGYRIAGILSAIIAAYDVWSISLADMAVGRTECHGITGYFIDTALGLGQRSIQVTTHGVG